MHSLFFEKGKKTPFTFSNAILKMCKTIHAWKLQPSSKPYIKQTEFYLIFYYIIVLHCPVLHWFDGIHLDNEHHQLFIVIYSDPNISIALMDENTEWLILILLWPIFWVLFIKFADHLQIIAWLFFRWIVWVELKEQRRETTGKEKNVH